MNYETTTPSSPTATTKERTNTSDSNNSFGGIGFLSPSYSKEDNNDYDSIAEDDSQVEENNEDDYHHQEEEEEEEDLMGSSGMLILEAQSSSPIRSGNNTKVVVAGRKYDLCGSMYKRRGGFGRNKENNWVKRAFTLYNNILCYHEETHPEQITDPSKPRARLNLAKIETIAEMHSKHKQGLPTDHLLTINIYDPVIRNKRKWEMCCFSKEEQVMWYNAIRAHDGPPKGQQLSMGRLLSSTTLEEHEGSLSLQHPLLSSVNKKMIHRSPSMEQQQEDVLLTKAAEKAVEVWMEKENSMNKKEMSTSAMVLLFVTMNVALYVVRNGSEETFHTTLFFINAFVLYVVMERTGTKATSKQTNNGKGLKAKVTKKKKRVMEETDEITVAAMEIEKLHHVKVMPGSTMPRSNPVENSELDLKLQQCGANSAEALRAYAAAPTESIQVQPHSYVQTDATLFNLRVGPNYKRNKQKAPSAPALYDLYSMDFLYDSTPLKNVTDKFKIPSIPGITDVSTGHAHIPPMLVINTWLPGEEPSVFAKNTDGGDTYSIPMVFVLSKDTLEQLKDIDTASPGVKLLSEWCRRAETEPDFRGRFKCMGQIEDIESTSIPKFIHGYNGKPALVTKSGTFTRHENYIEFTINVNYWAFLARKGLHALMPYFHDFIFNIGFTIEARHDEEMPEVLLGGCRVMNLDPEKAAVDV